ncbi:MAG: bifunctional precorrin-2 dehydrogenase/sirohydrochlorin ferrochelatase, partial [Bacteroidales bacterium]|nr:bifunctional precorrin-2 dehydrogenase/sirohydrochlorin ferrochelatase [Bacteroidales bacterium]
MAHLYPIYLNLAGKRCLVIGGGKVAERKVAVLLEYEASIRLVSPEVTESITTWSAQHLIDWRRGVFQSGDLDGTFMVFIATGDEDVNKNIAVQCRERGILVNAVDDPPNCDFYVPSILRRNSLCLAISTEGKSPLLAGKLRRELEDMIPEEYGEWVEILGSLRDIIKNSHLGIAERKRLFEELVHSDMLDLLRAGRKEKVEERIEKCMS